MLDEHLSIVRTDTGRILWDTHNVHIRTLEWNGSGWAKPARPLYLGELMDGTLLTVEEIQQLMGLHFPNG